MDLILLGREHFPANMAVVWLPLYIRTRSVLLTTDVAHFAHVSSAEYIFADVGSVTNNGVKKIVEHLSIYNIMFCDTALIFLFF